jgi:hypothetical protein
MHAASMLRACGDVLLQLLLLPQKVTLYCWSARHSLNRLSNFHSVMIGDCGVVPSSKGTTTTAALQQPVAAPRRATKPAARAAPAGALRQLSKHRRDALQGRRLVLSRRPCVATHGTAATAAVAPTRFLAIA